MRKGIALFGKGLSHPLFGADPMKKLFLQLVTKTKNPMRCLMNSMWGL